VGKSTLFNRLAGRRRALVGDEPGITRDRIIGTAAWRGRTFPVTDTGGLVPGDEAEIPAAVFRQARQAMASAAVIVLVVDGRSELAAPDLELAQRLRQTGKPILLAVNKIEGVRAEAALAPFHQLGLEPLYPLSAEHGDGLDVLLDAALPFLDAAAETTETAKPEIRLAIVGRPNVGKSTLLNRLLGEERSIVSPVAGTTRDAVDAVVERGKSRFRVIDTAGIRRKGATRLLAEKLSVVMARKHLEQADIALIVLDAGEPIESGVLALDATIAGYATESQRACVLVANKWDLAQSLGRTKAEYEQRVRERLKFLAYAPLVFVSAREGAGIPALYAAIARVERARRERVTTAALNRFLATLDVQRAPVPLGQRVKIYYISQVSAAPPQFVLFVDRARALHFAFRRYLENRIRQAFGFEGTPIVIKTRTSRAGKNQAAR
jgi:GTP-binding protein